MFDVICVGQAVIDCITQGKEEKPYKENVYRAKAIGFHLGGDALNEAIALKALGKDVGIVCGLGHDLAGHFIQNELERLGIDQTGVSYFEGPTPIAIIQVEEGGRRSSINSNATRLEGYQPLLTHLSKTKILSLASLFRRPLEDPKVVLELIKEAKKNGSIICADTKLPLIDSLKLEDFKEVLEYIDYIFPNENEAKYYTQKDTYEEMVQTFKDYGVKQVIIKLGEKGCFMDKVYPAIPVENIQDTTGAGDHFVSGFITGLLDGENEEACVNRGLRQAAFSISHTGGSH